MRLKTVILGGTGMLGSDLVSELAERYEVIAPTRAQLDVTDFQKLDALIQELQPDWVINSTAYTNVDGAEADRPAANLLNAVVPERLADICRTNRVRLLHFSTDQVFDGAGDKPFREEDATNPLNFYAKSKLVGESAVLRYPSHVVLRVQWLYGKQKDRFSPLKDKSIFTPFSDQVGAPTWTRDIARVVPYLLENRAAGLFHFAYDDFASWYDVYARVKARWNLSVKLSPKLTEEVKLPAARPLNCRLDNHKLRQMLNRPSLGSWQTALDEFLSSV